MIQRYRIVRFPDRAEVHLVTFDGKMNPVSSRKATDAETSNPKTWKKVSHDIGHPSLCHEDIGRDHEC